VAALNLTQVAALTTDQIAAMETTDIAAFKVAQIGALTTDQIVALTTDEVVALKTTQFAAMSTDQLHALTMSQVGAMLTTQTNALTTTQQSYLALASPLILDLNGDGVQTLSYSAGVKFDVFADGSSVNTGWVSSSDGLLVLDRNHDGLITDGSELFGTATQLANGNKAPNGYAALRESDSNGDGVIDNKDSIYADLHVWVDANSDGKSQAGELKTLLNAGVASIGLQDTATLSKDNGNLIGLTSSYQTTDGSTHATADVWFVADKSSSAGMAVTPVDSAIAALNVMAAPKASPLPYATLKDVDIPARAAMQTLAFRPEPWSGSDVASAATGLVQPVQAVAQSDIRSSVSSLAQAIKSFESIGAANREAGTVQTPESRTPAQSAAALTVTSMVDVMKGFDSNGNSLFAANSGSAALGKNITLPNLQDPSKNGTLASPAG
jgi:hypothetical protein